jgi:hypothetical protein
MATADKSVRFPWDSPIPLPAPPKLKPLFPAPSGVTVPKGCPLKQQWLENCIADAKDLNAPLGRVEKIPGARIKGEHIGTVDGLHVYAVDANAVNLAYATEMKKSGDLNDFVDFGNQTRWAWMPDVFFANRVLATDPTERTHGIVHEAVERKLSRDHGWPYSKSHPMANVIEVELMKLIDPCPACGSKKEKCTCVAV